MSLVPSWIGYWFSLDIYMIFHNLCGFKTRLRDYSSGTVNSNMVNSKFHFIQSFCDISVKCFPIISCLKCTVNSNFHLIRRKTLPTNDFELTVSDLYIQRTKGRTTRCDIFSISVTGRPMWCRGTSRGMTRLCGRTSV